MLWLVGRLPGTESLKSSHGLIPFLLVILGVLYALYGGVATPSETAAVGALLCLGLAIIIYRMTDLISGLGDAPRLRPKSR